jgi:predicted dehydrogenase
MQEVRFAIVGMGIGRHNARALHHNPRGRVVALCDLVPARMEEFAAEFDERPKFYTDYHAMCQDPDIDAVFVGTPNQYHVPVALEVVHSGKHVMVTKPLADSESAACELVEAAEAAGVVNMMSLSTRFSNEVLYLGALAQAGELGSIYYAHASSVRRSGIPDWNTGFITKGGGAFRDMGVHALDAAWWLMGLPKPVSVPASFYGQFAADDYGGGFITFENGAGLQIESFWASHQPRRFQIELFGSEAGATYDPLMIYRTVNGAPQDIAVSLPETGTAWDNIAAHWIACILDGVPCRAPLRHGLQVQQMMEALLQSAATGHEVALA